MIISIWRYGHLVLAVSSFIFIAIASLTGVVLSLEPVSDRMQGYQVADPAAVTLAEVVDQVRESYDEVFSLKVDAHDFVILSAIDHEGNMGDFYINPKTGENIGEIIEQHPVFEFATSLHRSLFLKGFGRFFVGLNCFLLLLIVVSGIVLIAQRQQGIRHFFSKIIRENFFQYYHAFLGRLALIPILIITVSGTYLSLQRFEVIPEGKRVVHMIDYELLTDQPAIDLIDFPAFKELTLDQVRSMEFPFSSDVEDFYTLQLRDEELIINQYTGEVLARASFPLVQILADLSLILHTGRGSVIWALILGIASCSILFFIYSGFQLTFKRKSTKIKNQLRKDECEFVILIGSETGTTISFAMQLHMALLEQGKSSYITDLNRYTRFEKMKHLVVISATYGQGEPPANADKFKMLFSDNLPKHSFTFSVVGFGSLAYADFCGYAYEVDELLQKSNVGERLLKVHAINNRSWESFRSWSWEWSSQLAMKLELPGKNPAELSKRRKTELFEVIGKTDVSQSQDGTFLIELYPVKRKKLHSGDLLAVFPPNDPHERLYSIAVTSEENILLSIKRHEHGICSNYLSRLEIGEIVQAGVVYNEHFHFPKKAQQTVMIGTGTGIAPFLGMLNQKKVEIHLYWGGRNKQSLELYKIYIENSLQEGRLARFNPAFSRMGDKVYVQDLIVRDRQLIGRILRDKGVIMICGSIAMQREVIDHLEEIVMELNRRPLSYYQNRHQLLMDCY